MNARPNDGSALNPFLSAHKLLDRFYLVSCPGPISIRDQMLRGAILVDRLLVALVAVGIAAPIEAALVQPGAKEALPLHDRD